MIASSTLRLFLIITISFWLTDVFAQEGSPTFSVKGIVFDESTQEVLPFVNIYKARDEKGTISDFEGQFTLQNVRTGDTITFSFIGYDKFEVIVDKDKRVFPVNLKPSNLELGEFLVLGDNSFLYDIVVKSRKVKGETVHSGKTYFELESYHNDKQLELFQGYYNGSVKGYDLLGLEMKRGRFALAPLSKRFFASTESSKAMYMHHLLGDNPYFPDSPFELNKRKLKRFYDLKLVGAFTNQEKRKIYIIQFEPSRQEQYYFSGKVWIDSASSEISQVFLQIEDAAVHPFKSIWPSHTLEEVSMELTKSFERMDDEMVLKSVNFDYSTNYRDENNSFSHISTRAVLNAYNFEETFIPPRFDFSNTSNTDYRKIQMLPVNDDFWVCTDEFMLSNNAESRVNFLNSESTVESKILFSSDTIFQRRFFESPFAVWNGNRIIIKGISEDSSRYYDKKRTLASQRYHLEVQLFADVSELCDTTLVVTKAIFDPYKSFYLFETTPQTQMFLNIYYDLMEIERRKLQSELEKCGTNKKELERVYDRALQHAQEISNLYFKEVQRGSDRKALKKWNDVVLKELEINNINLFLQESHN